jgi:peroxiredoxin Q/BCP
MASVDSLEDNTKFAQMHEADFPILADPSKATAMKYGVIRTDRPPEQRFAARWTFYIGPDGKIADIERQVSPASAGQAMIAKLDALGVKKK